MNSKKLTPVAFYEPKLGKNYRVVINFKDSLLPLIWFSVGNDGSVYIGSSQKEKNFLATGKTTTKDGEINIKYKDAVPIDPKQFKNPSKTSFHSSTIINTMDGEGERFDKIQHRRLTGQTLLSLFAFRHPKNMSRKLVKLKNTDMLIEYPFDESRPLHGYIYLGRPQDSKKHMVVDTATEQINLILEYRNLVDCDDLDLQIVLAHGPQGPWPPYSFKVFPVGTSNKEDKE